MLWQIFLAILIIWICVVQWKRRELYKISHQLKNSLRSWPLVGHALWFWGNDEVRMEALKLIGKEALHQGGMTTAWLGNRLYIVIADPQAAEVSLRNCLEKDDIVRLSKYILGNGSIFAPETTLGVQLHAQKNPNQPFLKAFEQYCHLITSRMCQPWLHADFVYKLHPDFKTLTEARNCMHGFIKEIIKSKHEEINYNNHEGEVENNTSNHKTFVDLLITSGDEERGFSDLELQEESLVIVMAGTDTSAVGTAFTTVLLSWYQDVQDLVYKELKEVFGDSKRLVEPEDLPRLKYLEAVIKETFRLYPPVPITLRKVTSDLTFPSGVTLVKGCSTVIHIWALHRNPKYWGPDVEQFRPERFLGTELRHPAQFAAFSFGARNCVGYQYAMMSAKTVLATILRQYRILPGARFITDNFVSCDYLGILDEQLATPASSGGFSQPSLPGRLLTVGVPRLGQYTRVLLSVLRSKMHCFICVTYLFIIATAHPGKDREPSVQQERRSLFHDVIESLRIRAQLPGDFNQNENNVGDNYRPYEYDNEEHLPSDGEFIPRRNDRIEMPPLKYRYPKSLNVTDEFEPKEEIILYITDTTKEPKTTTVKPKKTKRTKPPVNKKTPRGDEISEGGTQKPEYYDYKPMTNNMAGQSQIGNRESQMVVKPTVIVNLRGSVNHRDGEIRIAGRNRNVTNDTFSLPNVPQNIFNINQEVKLERTFTTMGSTGGQKNIPDERQEYKIEEKNKIEEDMMMCETATWNPEKNRDGRKYRNVLQILLSM